MHFFHQDRRILWFFFVLALALRLFGLSHDLHHEVVYHPDTPKQMRAVQQFLRDDYLVFQGHSDYDGYPYFNSHLVEYIVRGVMGVETAWLKWTGAWTGPVDPPTYRHLFWLTRVLNALLSAVSVPLLFVIGLRFSRRVAWIAAVWLLLSPLDISAAHFASNDTTVAFFCLLSLWFGVRISEQGRWRDLAGGAFCIAAAFSTKYHGAIAIVPVFFGHVLYCHKNEGIFSRRAIGRWMFLALAGVLGIFVTSPALLVNLEASVDSILHFFQYTANFNMSDEFKELPIYHRFWIGLRENIPVIANAVSWPVLGLFMVAIATIKHDPRLSLIVLVPLVHIVVGLSGKPYLHQSHHTPITAYLFLAAAVVASVCAFRWCRTVWFKRGVLLLGAWTILHLARFTTNELMSFHVTDSRRVAETWMLDSMPRGVQWLTSRYSLMPPQHVAPKLPVYVSAQSGDRPRLVPGMIEWTRFSLIRNNFSVFINRAIHLHTISNDHVRLPVSTPYVLPIPSDRRDSALSLDAPWFGRSSRVRDVSFKQPIRVWAVSTQQVHQAWLVVRTGENPVLMDLSFGGRRSRVHLPAGRYQVVPLQDPRSFRIPFETLRYYRWRADVVWGAARVILVTDPADLARWAFAHHDHAIMSEALTHVREPSLVFDLMRVLVSPQLDGEYAALRARAQRLLDEPAAWLEYFGMSEEWLSLIPYLAWDAEAWVSTERNQDETSPGWAVGPLLLDPADYRLRVEGPQGNAARYAVTDGANRVIQQGQLSPEGEVILVVSPPGDPITITLEGLDEPPERTTIRPDARAMVERWIKWLDQAVSFDDPINHVPSNTVIGTFHDTVHLVQADVIKEQALPGGFLDLKLVWWPSEEVRRLDRPSMWIHLVSADGERVAQYDKGLLSFLREIRPDPRDPPLMIRLSLPETLAPGRYELRLGMWIPSQRKRWNVTFSTFPHAERYMVIDTIDITSPLE